MLSLQREYTLWHQEAESYYFLWQKTRDQKFRDYAWRLVKAIDKHARIKSGGFATTYAKYVPSDHSNQQREWFLGATLKYLYLIFSQDQLLPSDQWIFNNAGHPLPIYGQNEAYPLKANSGKI